MLLEGDFCGSFPPLITPFQSDGSVDFESFGELIEFQISEGSHGITVCGTTAEPSLLTVEERRRCAEMAVEVAGDRLPVIVATGSQSIKETLDLSKHADAVGADAILVVTPYYVRPPQHGIVSYFGEIAGQVEIPILIYHIPGRAAVSVSVDTLEQIKEQSPSLIGMKHASNDLSLVTDSLLRLGDTFRIFVGLEELSYPMLALGATGLMNAVGNLLPHKVAQLYNTMSVGDFQSSKHIHRELWSINRAVFFDTNPIPMKYMMKRLGIIRDNIHRLPMAPATPEVESKCDLVLRELGCIS